MKKNWWNSLPVKIIAWSFVPTAIILSAEAWFTFYSYQKVIGDVAIKQDQEVVREKAVQAMKAINGLVEPALLPIILEIDTRHEGSHKVCAQNILDQGQGLDIYDGGIYFLDQQGRVFKTRPEQPELIGQDWSDTPQFRYLQEHNNWSASTDLRSIGPSEKKIVCTAMAMIGQKGETVGATYFCSAIYPATQSKYYQTLNNLNLGPNVYILDGNQHIIYSPDPSEMGKDLSGEPYLQQLLQGQSTSGRFRNGSDDMVASYIRVSSIEVKTGDEIGTLADQFNLMSTNLDDSCSSLENKVADRTRELAVVNR